RDRALQEIERRLPQAVELQHLERAAGAPGRRGDREMVRTAQTRRRRGRGRGRIGRRGISVLLFVLACGGDAKPPAGPHAPPPADSPPQVTFQTLPPDVWENVTIYVSIRDPEGDRASLRLLW